MWLRDMPKREQRNMLLEHKQQQELQATARKRARLAAKTI
jgi:hypothetical protein